MAKKCSLVFTNKSPVDYIMETSLVLLWTVCIGGTLAFEPLREYETDTWVPFTAVIFPNLQSIPPFPYSESTNNTSMTGIPLFFNHLFWRRSNIYILSIKIWYNSVYYSQFLSSKAIRFENMSSLIPEPSND